MTKQPTWRRYLRLWGPDVQRDVDDEFEFHIQTRAAEHVARGMPVAEARARALAEFGDISGAKAQCREIGEHQLERRRWSDFADSLRQDARYALRLLARSPGFTAVVVLTLALGIGATTAIFSVVHGVLLRPLPYAQPDRLVKIWETTPQGQDHNVVAAGNYLDWRQRAKSFAELGAHRWPYGVALTGDGDPTQILVTDVTPSIFSVLGVRPLLGRLFTEEESDSRSRVAILSHGFWSQRYGADPGIVGRRIVINDISYTVIGVMPATFEFPSPVAAWRPVYRGDLDPQERRSHNWNVIARLRPSVPLATAQAEMRTLGAVIAKENPEFLSGFSVNVQPMHADLVAAVRPLLLILLAGAAVVLLVACANIANLLLARTLMREREIAVRGALGAGRRRVLQQLLTESIALAGTGGVLGVALAAILVRGLLAMAPTDIPLLSDVTLDVRVLAFAAGITLLCALLFGIAPALRLARADLQSTLRAANDRGGGVRHGGLRGLLLVGEVALSLVLLVGAGLLLRSAQRLRTVDYGYRAHGLLAVSLDLPRVRYDSLTRQQQLYEQLMERVRVLPGVASVAATTEPPASGNNMTFGFVIEGRPASNARGREDPQQLRVVTPSYFQTMGQPVISGRSFDESDRAATTAVVIINEALARRHWPNDNPVGKRISLVGHEGPWMQIVGVVGDTRIESVDAPPPPALYMPYAQRRPMWSWMSWASVMIRVRPGVEPMSLLPGVRAALWELDARLPIHGAMAVEDAYGQTLARRRFATTLLGAFAALALTLGVVGMYGVLSYSVAQRRREMAIRLALGAGAGQVVRVVLVHAVTLASLGVLLGSLAALGLTRWLGTLLYEVSPRDPLTFVGVAVLLLLVAVLAACIPTRRALRIDPMTVMREA